MGLAGVCMYHKDLTRREVITDFPVASVSFFAAGLT